MFDYLKGKEGLQLAILGALCSLLLLLYLNFRYSTVPIGWCTSLVQKYWAIVFLFFLFNLVVDFFRVYRVLSSTDNENFIRVRDDFITSMGWFGMCVLIISVYLQVGVL